MNATHTWFPICFNTFIEYLQLTTYMNLELRISLIESISIYTLVNMMYSFPTKFWPATMLPQVVRWFWFRGQPWSTLRHLNPPEFSLPYFYVRFGFQSLCQREAVPVNTLDSLGFQATRNSCTFAVNGWLAIQRCRLHWNCAQASTSLAKPIKSQTPREESRSRTSLCIGLEKKRRQYAASKDT